MSNLISFQLSKQTREKLGVCQKNSETRDTNTMYVPFQNLEYRSPIFEFSKHLLATYSLLCARKLGNRIGHNP